MTNVVFILFYAFLHFIGRGFLILISIVFKKNENFDLKKVGNLELRFYYPILALFVIGNLGVIFNYFIGVDSFIFLSFLLLLVLLNLKKINIPFNKELIIYQIFIPFTVSISAYGIGFAEDAGLYHLNTQNWIREEKIHFGLANLHSRYGYSSIYEYISANFWISENFIFLHFVNLSFIVLFFSFLFANLKNSENNFLKNLSLITLLFGILDNFGMGGGRNGFIDIEAIGKYDTPFAILYFISGALIINAFINKIYNPFELNIFIYLILFAVQLRILGITLVPLLLAYYFTFIKRTNNKVFSTQLILPSLLSFIWISKNLLVSGCLLYPVIQTCFTKLPWYIGNAIFLEVQEINTLHIQFTPDQQFFNWLEVWLSKDINYNTLINFFVSFFIIYIFQIIFYKKVNNPDLKYIKSLIFITLIIALLVLISSAPAIRFAIGVFLFAFTYIAAAYHQSEERFKVNNKFKSYLIIMIFFMSLSGLIRANSYGVFFSSYSQLMNIQQPSIKYNENPLGWGVVTLDKSSGCWINLECIPIPKKVSLTKGYYNYFQISY
jgi:hypothetical protein